MLWYKSCWVGRNFRNFVERCLWMLLHYLGLHAVLPTDVYLHTQCKSEIWSQEVTQMLSTCDWSEGALVCLTPDWRWLLAESHSRGFGWKWSSLTRRAVEAWCPDLGAWRWVHLLPQNPGGRLGCEARCWSWKRTSVGWRQFPQWGPVWNTRDKRCCSGETVQENRVKMLSGLKIQTAHYVFLYIMFKYANEAI